MVGVFNARVAQANLITETDFDAKLKKMKLIKKITSNKTKHLLVEKTWTSWKHLIQAILLAKAILKKMTHKII